MNVRVRALFGALALSLPLAACGGGTNSVVSGGGGGNGQIPPGSVSIAPAALTFTGPGAAAQTFTVNSTVGNVAAPAINGSGCAPVVSIATTSTTLPATYTVTPTANGSCTLTVDLGNASAALGITVGPAGGNTITGSTNNVVLYVGGTSGSVSVSSPSNTYSTDTTACTGIATVTPLSNTNGSQVYTVAPVAAGSCQFVIWSGSSSTVVGVTVNPQQSGPASLSLTSSTMTFSNSTASAPQQDTLNFSGPVGAVTINENDCIGNTGKPKLAYLTVNNSPPGAPVSLPASFTVTLYGAGATGSCTINFVPQNGTGATLTVNVNP
jgi:hypothetical protein